MKKIIYTVLVISWMGVIIWFSAQSAKISSEMSYGLGIKIGSFIISDFDEWDENRQQLFAERIEYPLRKAAHATEYAVLAILLSAMLRSYGLRGKKHIMITLLFTIGYAATDEVHQLFVPGRSGQITDVMIDGGGAVIGVILQNCFWLVVEKWYQNGVKLSIRKYENG